ncbi:putative guanine nucleotide-exchange factor SED4 [Nakaseomyces bracarensis]|uniref:Guanine nucleotide-exchange factor SEC12 n=1 Tax=Nakaseomyces bracarensis TaxID=273131 RepID=A0ABR4NZC4_9SACH
MKFAKKLYKVGYPLYGAKFLDNDQVIVTGGGGEGNNGVDNKITVLEVSKKDVLKIKEVCETTLPSNDDSPTALDCVNGVVLVGCNENSGKIKSGKGNNHIRKFRYNGKKLQFESSADLDKSRNPDDYTKLIRISRDGTEAAIASSKNPPVMTIIDPRNYSVKFEIETGRDVKDLHFSPNGKLIAYVTQSSLEIISTVTGSCVLRKTDFDRNVILSKIKFMDDNTVLIAATWSNSKGILMTKISIKSGKTSVLWSRQITSKFKGITSMDVNRQGNLAILSTNDNSVLLVKLRNLSVGKLFTQVHGFAITRVVFSPDSRYAASISAAETIHLIEIPADFATSKSIMENTTQWIMNTVLILFLAYIINYMYQENMHAGMLEYFSGNGQNTSSSVQTYEDMEQVTLVGTIHVPNDSYDVSTAVPSVDSAVAEKERLEQELLESMRLEEQLKKQLEVQQREKEQIEEQIKQKNEQDDQERELKEREEHERKEREEREEHERKEREERERKEREEHERKEREERERKEREERERKEREERERKEREERERKEREERERKEREERERKEREERERKEREERERGEREEQEPENEKKTT